METRHWLSILSSSDWEPGNRKLRWKILREGFSLDAIPQLLASSSWTVLEQSGGAQTGATKLLLQSNVVGDRCEMVVLFPKGNRCTVCVSSQIGCAVGCLFCATGKMGFRRQLSSFEILEQVYMARQIAKVESRHLRNVVFMGMGEPLHNISEVTKAIQFITDEEGFGIAPRRVTLSTSAPSNQLLTFVKENPRIPIAISLHSANNVLRRELMPRAMNDLDHIGIVIHGINQLQPNIPVWLEYVLLKDLNDRETDIDLLIEFCHGLRVEINLIPWNPINNGLHTTLNATTDRTRREEIALRLKSAGIKTTIRQSFGQMENAACGQLVVLN